MPARELFRLNPHTTCPDCDCRIIAENFLEGWWADLEETLTTDKQVDTQTIHRIMT